MSIASELTRIQNAKAGIKSAIEAKGVTVGDGTIDTYPAKINEIQTGGGSVDEYFNTTANGGNSYSTGAWMATVKKLPPLTTSGTNLSYFFQNYRGTTLDLTNMVTDTVTSMREMFLYCKKITNLDLSNFNTSNVTNMYGMFSVCSSLTTLNLSSFNTSKVTVMNGMFNQCNSLTTLNLNNFNTSKVTDMTNMFNGCHSLTSLDCSSFEGTLVSNMQNMFRDCISLTSVDLSNFNAPKVTNLDYMFFMCSQLKNLNLSSFDFTNITSHSYMLYQVPTDCYILVKDATAKEWITSKYTTLTNVHYVGEEG